MPARSRTRIIFMTKESVLKKNPMIVPEKREQDGGVHRDDPLAVKQAYSCEQDQRYRLSADFFDELQFHVLYNFKYE